MEKKYIIGIIIVITIVIGIVLYYKSKTKNEEKSLLNKYMETNFTKNKITTKYYEDPTVQSTQINRELIKLSKANIDILKEIEKSVCGSNNINWNIDNPNIEVELGEITTQYLDINNKPITYELKLPYYFFKLIGLFHLIVNKYTSGNPNITFTELFNKLSNDEKDKLAIISLIGWQIGAKVEDEEYKNYISFSNDFSKFIIKNDKFLQNFKDLRNTENNADFLVEIKDEPLLSRDDFTKYNIIGIINTLKEDNLSEKFTTSEICKA